MEAFKTIGRRELFELLLLHALGAASLYFMYASRLGGLGGKVDRGCPSFYRGSGILACMITVIGSRQK